MSVTNIAVLTLLLVLALVVLVKRGKKVTDFYLFATILAIAGYIASDIWVKHSLNHHSFAFHSIASYFSFLPILFYGLLLISKSHRVKKSWGWFVVFHVVYSLFIVGDVYIWNDYTISDIQKTIFKSTLALSFFSIKAFTFTLFQ